MQKTSKSEANRLLELQRTESSPKFDGNGCSRTPSVKFAVTDSVKSNDNGKKEINCNFSQTRTGSIRLGEAKRVPISRIATEASLKTITHKVKRPAVDIEFHDLVYLAKTGSGKFDSLNILSIYIKCWFSKTN